MTKHSFVILLIAASATLGFAQVKEPKLTPQSSGTTQLLIAVSPVNADIRLGRRHRRNLRGHDQWR